jgi:hypothetical protein
MKFILYEAELVQIHMNRNELIIGDTCYNKEPLYEIFLL